MCCQALCERLLCNAFMEWVFSTHHRIRIHRKYTHLYVPMSVRAHTQYHVCWVPRFHWYAPQVCRCSFSVDPRETFISIFSLHASSWSSVSDRGWALGWSATVFAWAHTAHPNHHTDLGGAQTSAGASALLRPTCLYSEVKPSLPGHHLTPSR